MKKTLLGLAAVLAFFYAHAENYYWKSAADGYFDDAANWNLGAAGAGGAAANAPGEGDKAKFCKGTYTVAFRQNTKLDSFYPENTDNNQEMRILAELAGHTLVVTNVLSVTADKSHPNAWLTFTNGTVACEKGISVSANGSTAFRANMIFDSAYAVATGQLNVAGLNPSFVLRNGAALNAGSLYMNTIKTNALMRVTGKDTVLKISGEFNQYGTGDILVEDGALLDVGTHISVRGYASDTADDFGGRLVVNNASVTNRGLSSYLNIGINTLHGNVVTLTNNATWHGNGYATLGDSVSCSNRLEILDGSVLDFDGFQYGTSRTCDGLYVGKATTSRENVLYVNNGTYSARFLCLGCNTTSSTDCNSNNWIHVAGTKPLVKTIAQHINGYSLFLYSGAGIRFDMGKDGYENVPIQVNGTFRSYHATSETFANVSNKLVVAANPFDKAHPKQKLTLITTKNDSTAALQELIDNCTFEGAANPGSLAIENSGKALVYTAPTIRGLSVVIR